MLPACLSTKLTVPHPGEDLVARPRLLHKLDQSVLPNKRLTILSAPAGYGKTALVSSWIRQWAGPVPELKAAWLSLDAGDNDPVRFWSYLVSAFQCRESNLGKDALDLLASSGGFPQQTFLITLLNDLARWAEPWLLVLDDYHFVEEPAIHQTLAYLVERLPDQGHLLILTRSDPPLPIPLLRGRGQLLEIRQDDLCFLDEEAASFLVDCLRLDLSMEDIRLLNARTEGWASGLRLAAISLEGQADQARFIRSFTGTNRYILDYLINEVLERQQPEMRDFLLRTSILDVLSAPLCAAITDCSDEDRVNARCGVAQVQSLLERLQRSNLFVIPLDDEHVSFRYHHLFADLLRRQLSAIHPDLVEPLHAGASAWFEQHGLPEQAIHHALLARDYGRSAALLGESADALWRRGEHATLSRLVRSLPESYRATNPRLLTYEAVSFVSAGQLNTAEQCLDQIERLMATLHSGQAEAREIVGRVAATRVLVAAYRGEADRALAYAQVAREHLPEGESAWTGRYAVAAGNVLLMAGRFREGWDEMARAMQAGKDSDSPYIYLMAATMLGILGWSQGRGGEAWRLTQEALAYLRAKDLEGAPVASGISVVEGILLLERGLLGEAEALISRGLQVASLVSDFSMVALAYLGLVMCRLSRTDWQGADETLARAELTLAHHEYPIWTECVLAGIRSIVMIKQCRLAEAEQYLYRRNITVDGEVTYPHQNEYLSLAHLLIQQIRFDAAEQVITRLEQYCEASEMQVWLIPICLLRTRINLAHGLLPEAQNAMRSAWTLAQSTGRYQDFQNLDGELFGLFQQVASPQEVSEPVWRLITQAHELPRAEAPIHPAGLTSATSTLVKGTLVERLSERELEVLGLIAAGLSNKEISQRLHIEIQTVKFHAGNIYGKLGVENRVQAIAQAQELGILAPGSVS